MLCKNCQKEIGQQTHCHYCGFNPALDEGKGSGKQSLSYVPPRPVQINLRKKTNGIAIAALLISILLPFFGSPISLIMGIIGFFKGKTCRSGRIMSILSILISLVCIILIIVLIVAVYAKLYENSNLPTYY